MLADTKRRRRAYILPAIDRFFLKPLQAAACPINNEFGLDTAVHAPSCNSG